MQDLVIKSSIPPYMQHYYQETPFYQKEKIKINHSRQKPKSNLNKLENVMLNFEGKLTTM